MLFERIAYEGLAHYSYVIGDGGEALVIDPRLDTDVYESIVAAAGYRLRYILETHRNEDYLIGSAQLADRTGAEVWHADAGLDYLYGQAVEDGQEWGIGSLRVSALETPGHTSGHMSYLLHQAGGDPWMVFSGDALFAGAVGRTDLLAQRRDEEAGADAAVATGDAGSRADNGGDEGRAAREEATRLLYRSIHERLLPLGDAVLLCPAHGSGSVCGGGAIADRPWTTLGIERRLNPALSLDEETFVRQNSQMHERPPYFGEMERRNLEGARLPGGSLRLPPPLPPRLFAEAARSAQVLDVREPECFGAAHIPGSLDVYEAGVAGFAGWFLSYDRPLALVLAAGDPEPLTRMLVRIGYDRLEGYLTGGVHAWYTQGMPTEQVECITAKEAWRRLETDPDNWALDVRSREELESDGEIPGAVNIPIREVLEHLDEIPRDRPVVIFCGSGRRSMIVASLLRPRGWERLTVVLGGIHAWIGVGAPVEAAGRGR